LIIERERVRRLVRAELQKRLGSAPSSASHPALIEVVPSEACAEDESRPRPACVIEPDRPCYNSGYCKRLGY
jgi:hypothetical protein